MALNSLVLLLKELVTYAIRNSNIYPLEQIKQNIAQDHVIIKRNQKKGEQFLNAPTVIKNLMLLYPLKESIVQNRV